MLEEHRAGARGSLALPPLRPEYLRDTVAGSGIGVVQKPLTVWQRLAQQAWLRKALILTLIATVWELYARRLNNPLLVPTFFATVEAFWAGINSGDILIKVLNSVQLLLKGYALGLSLAMLFTALAMMSRLGNDLLETLTSAFNPLPAIALLPLALIWFGLGDISIIFVLGALGAVGGGPQHPFRLPIGLKHLAHGGAQLRPQGAAVHRQDPHPGRLPVDPDGAQDRLGLCLAHVDRRRTGVWRLFRQGRAWLVYL